MMGFFEEITNNANIFIPIILAFIATIFIIIVYPYLVSFLMLCKIALNAILSRLGLSKDTEYSAIHEEIESAGYKYDPKQDIFYSIMEPWQKEYGYCRLYDEAAAPTGMIIDCEPIYFEYDNKRWLIGLWKGQYDLTTGGEIGVYNTDGPDLNIPGIFNGTFFKSDGRSNLLYMSFILKKNGKTLFKRKGRHWWLTGFKLGEFSEPSELTMDISIRLKDKIMRNAFLKGLKEAGYQYHEIIVKGNTVNIFFDKPKTPQPITRTSVTDWVIQRKNEKLCELYQSVIGMDDSMENKAKAIKEVLQDAYEKVKNIGRTKPLFEGYEKIKDFID